MEHCHKKESSPTDKRQLPCFTWVSTGDCMYQNKCRYIHPPYINKEETLSDIKTIKRIKKIDVNDTFFWPKIENHTNDIKYKYNLPIPDKHNKHDAYLFSLWKHYVLYCKYNNPKKIINSNLHKKNLFLLKKTTFDPYYTKNNYTQTRRLNVFVQLSQSKSIEK